MNKILLLNNDIKPCGIQQYGSRLIKTLQKSKKYLFFYKEASSEDEVIERLSNSNYALVLYNYSPGTMPFLSQETILRFPEIKHMAFIHEGYSHLNNFVGFDGIIYFHSYVYISPEYKDRVFYTPIRHLLKYSGEYPINTTTKIGSFGFGFPRKRYDYIVETVNNEFDVADIVFHISNSFHSDPVGEMAEETIKKCREKITKPGITLTINRDFISDDNLLKFLAGNDINCFFYDAEKLDGIAGSPDLALSVNRPIAITKVPMLSHLYSLVPEICIENSSIKEIIKMGTPALNPIYNCFSYANLVSTIENFCDRLLKNV